MREPAESFVTHIEGESLKIAELFEVTLSTGTTYYYTSHSENITWGSPPQTYNAIPIQRTNISLQMNLEADAVTLTLENITEVFMNMINANVLDGAMLTIKRIIYTDTYAADKEIILFVGTMDCSYNRKTLSMSCSSILNSLNHQVPKELFQESCNNRLFDSRCGLTKASFLYEGVATGDGANCFSIVDTDLIVYTVGFSGGDEDNPIAVGEEITGGIGAGTAIVANIIYQTASAGIIWYAALTGVQFVNAETLTGDVNTVIVNGTPAQDLDLYELGEIKITSGANLNTRRTVRVMVDTGGLVVMTPFYTPLLTGCTYELYAGCDKVSGSCQGKFNNLTNFNGYLYIPKAEEAIL